MTIVTDESIMISPIACINVQCSPRNNRPEHTAVRGSRHPKMADVVAPMRFSAKISVRSEIRVDTRPNMARLIQASVEGTSLIFSSVISTLARK